MSWCTFSKISTYRVTFVIQKKNVFNKKHKIPLCFGCLLSTWTESKSLCSIGKACHNLAPPWRSSLLFLPGSHTRGLLSHAHVTKPCSRPLPAQLCPSLPCTTLGDGLLPHLLAGLALLLFVQLLKLSKFSSASGPLGQLFSCLDRSSHDQLPFIFPDPKRHLFTWPSPTALSLSHFLHFSVSEPCS